MSLTFYMVVNGLPVQPTRRYSGRVPGWSPLHELDTVPTVKRKRSQSSWRRNALRRRRWLQRRDILAEVTPSLSIRPAVCNVVNDAMVSTFLASDSDTNASCSEMTRATALDAASRVLQKSREAWKLLVQLVESFKCDGGKLQSLFISDRPWLPAGCRQRDMLPLEFLAGDDERAVDLTDDEWACCIEVCNCVIVSLHWLAGIGPSCPGPRRRLEGQRLAVRRIIDSVVDFAARIAVALDAGGGTMPGWTRDSPHRESNFVPLRASEVDGLVASGRVDPSPSLSAAVQHTLSQPSLLFPQSFRETVNIPTVRPEDNAEYLKLVALQLRSGKLGLTVKPRSGGGVFVVGRAGSSKLREVWHGRKTSLAARRPPKPRYLASPTALTHLVALPGKPVRVSKRDARC